MLQKGMQRYLALAILISQFLCSTAGMAQEAGDLHLYQGIPMEGTTPEMVSKILWVQKGVPFEVATQVWSGNAYGVEDFGYRWNLQLDFNKDDTGVNRILLSGAQPARVEPEAFSNRVQTDLLQFIDVEKQLSALYGEPDIRFFLTVGLANPAGERWMFESGDWEIEPMAEVCEQNLQFQSFSVWGNVVLQTWVDRKKPNVEGKYLSRVMLYYYPELQATDAMRAATVAMYPDPVN